MKQLLDAELFEKLLKDWGHQLSLVTFVPAEEKKLVVAFFDSKAFPADVVGLIKKGARLDYFRYPTPVGDQRMILFGRDGLPTFMGTSGGGLATARFFVQSTPALIVEVRKVTESMVSAISEVQGFYDLAATELDVQANDMSKRFGAT